MQPRGREFDPRTLHSLLYTTGPPLPVTVESPAYAVIRFAMYAALIGLAGAAFFVLLLLRRVRGLGLGSDLFAEDAASAARRIALVCVTVLLIATPARLIAQSLVLFGNATDILGAVTTTLWGRAWLLQCAGAAVALIALLGARGIAVLRWRVAGIGAIAIALGFSLSGHAAAVTRYEALAVVVDSTHILAAGAWVGTLTALAIAGIPAALRTPEATRAGTAAALVNAFSPLALLAAAILAVTGTFAAWEALGGFAPLFQTPYGNMLLRKLFFIAVMAVIGAVNWRVLRPKLGTELAARAIRRSAFRELAVAVVVIAFTALLVAMPTHDEDAPAAASAAASSVQ